MFKSLLSFLILFFATLTTTHAQIKIDSDGYVGITTNPNNYTALRVVKAYSYPSYFSYGVEGISNGGGDYSYGVYGKAHGGMFSYGIYGEALGTTAFQTGVYGKAGNGFMYNHGVRGAATGTDNYGGYFTGGVYVSGGIDEVSDERLKKNIRTLNIEDISAKIRQLVPQRYEFLSATELKQRGLPVSHAEEGEHFGLLAQDLEEVFPELVTDVVQVLDEDLRKEEKATIPPQTVITKAINYTELTVLLLAAVQELQAEVEILKAQLNE